MKELINKDAQIVPAETHLLTSRESAEHAQRVVFLYIDELKRTPEFLDALRDAYFDTAGERESLQNGTVVFRRGGFVWESKYMPSSQIIKLSLTRYAPIEQGVTLEVQEAVGVKLSLNPNSSVGHADICYSHLFTPCASRNNVIEKNTKRAVREADKFLGYLRTASPKSLDD